MIIVLKVETQTEKERRSQPQEYLVQKASVLICKLTKHCLLYAPAHDGKHEVPDLSSYRSDTDGSVQHLETGSDHCTTAHTILFTSQ